MELIAKEADIARKTLYNYFPVKEAILSEHVQSLMAKEQIHLEELFKELPNTRSRLLAGFRDGAEWVKSNSELYKVYIQFRFQIIFKSNTSTDHRSGYQDLLFKVLDAGQKLGDI